MTTEFDTGSLDSPAAGLPCPRCQSRIQFSLQTLLRSPGIRCPSCGLELTIDAKESAEALAALQRFASELESIRQHPRRDPPGADDWPDL